jgi:cation transport ATPase
MNLRDLVFYLHLASLALAGGGMLYADTLAMSWMRGKKDTLWRTHLLRAHYTMTAALALLIATGIYLFWPMHTYLLRQPLFYIKMAFVVTLVINGFVIDRIMHVATYKSFRSLAQLEKLPLFVSGAVSVVCWVGAGTVALLLFY